MHFYKKLTLVYAITLFFFPNWAFSQIDSFEQNFNEARAILEEIQKNNVASNNIFDFRSGMFQIITNQESALKLNNRDQMFFIDIKNETAIKNRWGFVGSLLHAQNVLNRGSVNSSSSYLQSYQLGVRYRRNIDETNLKNYYSFKFQLYGMNNNFNLKNNQLFFAKSEMGFIFGLERQIPLTEKIDLRGEFDLAYMMRIKSKSILPYEKTGNGLQFQSELLYQTSKNTRMGGGYSIGAFFNKLKQATFVGKSSHTQIYQTLSFNYSYFY